MERLTRISYNSAGWRRPTGEAAAQEQGNTYNSLHGFGHEDWLFRDEWLIDGWRYAFIQGVGKSRKALNRAGLPFDLLLFTVEPDRRRRYVARIRDVEALDDGQADAAREHFLAAGWMQCMQEEIRAVGGNAAALGDARWASHVLNVRFRASNVQLLAPGAHAQPGDPIGRLNRYQLYKIADLREPGVAGVPKGTTLPPAIRELLRAPGATMIVVTPEHARMQKLLMQQLQAEHPGLPVVREQAYIDVLVETPASFDLYEIKSDLSPMTVLRLAIGQLLEYAFRLDNPQGKPIRLVAVGRADLTAEAKAYLARLRQVYALDVGYRVVKA